MDTELTVSEFLRKWLLVRRSRLQPQTIYGYEGVIRRYLEPQLGHLPLEELDVRTLERTWARLLHSGGQKGRPLAPKSVRGIAAVLAAALQHAVKTGLLDRNPARHATTPHEGLPGDSSYPDEPGGSHHVNNVARNYI